MVCVFVIFLFGAFKMSRNILEFGFLFSVSNLSEFDPEKLSEKEDRIYIIGYEETQEEVQVSFIIDKNNIAVSNYLGEDYEMKILSLSEIEELIRKRKELLEGLGFSLNGDSAEVYYRTQKKKSWLDWLSRQWN